MQSGQQGSVTEVILVKFVSPFPGSRSLCFLELKLSPWMFIDDLLCSAD
jgi:hypothetical protein